jgi:hypothetical protein
MPKKRYWGHIHAPRRQDYSSSWVYWLKTAGLRPRMCVIQQIPPNYGPSAERYWISYFRALGCPLTNLTEGGEGSSGHEVSIDTRIKIGAANRAVWARKGERDRRKPGASSIDALRVANIDRKGKTLPDETKAKLRAAWVERKKRPSKPRGPHTKVTKERLRQATLRQFEKPGAREAVSRVHKGKQISAEHRLIVSIATTKRWADWRASGSKTPKETRAKISAAKKGKPLSKEHKEKISTNTKGKPKSEEHKAKIKASLRARYKRED